MSFLDVFLIQLAGTRILADRPQRRVHARLRGRRATEDCWRFSPSREIRLDAGDLLYLPPVGATTYRCRCLPHLLDRIPGSDANSLAGEMLARLRRGGR